MLGGARRGGEFPFVAEMTASIKLRCCHRCKLSSLPPPPPFLATVHGVSSLHSRFSSSAPDSQVLTRQALGTFLGYRMDANPMQCNLVLGFSSSAFLVSSSLSCLLCVKKRFIFLFFQPGSKLVSSYSHSLSILLITHRFCY